MERTLAPRWAPRDLTGRSKTPQKHRKYVYFSYMGPHWTSMWPTLWHSRHPLGPGGAQLGHPGGSNLALVLKSSTGGFEISIEISHESTARLENQRRKNSRRKNAKSVDDYGRQRHGFGDDYRHFRVDVVVVRVEIFLEVCVFNHHDDYEQLFVVDFVLAGGVD